MPSREPVALTRNAADPKQVRNAADSEQERLVRRISNLGVVLSTYAGREDQWEFLGTCGVYRSIFDGHGARMSYNSGRQDIGLERLAMITTNFPELYLLMQKESIQREKNLVEPEQTKVAE